MRLGRPVPDPAAARRLRVTWGEAGVSPPAGRGQQDVPCPVPSEDERTEAAEAGWSLGARLLGVHRGLQLGSISHGLLDLFRYLFIAEMLFFQKSELAALNVPFWCRDPAGDAGVLYETLRLLPLVLFLKANSLPCFMYLSCPQSNTPGL